MTDFRTADHGTIILIWPVSDAAHQWVEENVIAAPHQKLREAPKPSIPPIEVLPPQFYIPDVLPNGVADAILSATGCRAESRQ